MSFLSNPQCVELGLEGAVIDDGGRSKFVFHGPLSRGLLVALVLFFVVMFLVLRVLCHCGLRMMDTVLCANVKRKKSLENRDSLPPTGGRRELTKGADLTIKLKGCQREGLSPWLSC